MKDFFIKCLIVYFIHQKSNYFMFSFFVVIITVLYFYVDIKIIHILIFTALLFLVFLLSLSIACIIYRKKHQRFKVYLSFSEFRIPQLAQYITDYLKPAFKVFNIDYFDFREHKRIDFFDEYAVCNKIDENLANSDIFLRFIARNLEPNKFYHVDDLNNNMFINPYTRELSLLPDYTKYEVDISFDKFGFNNPYNRFEIVSSEVVVASMKHISAIHVDPEENALDFTIRVIREILNGYNEQQYMDRNYLYRSIRG